jgi:hypothetical protein
MGVLLDVSVIGTGNRRQADHRNSPVDRQCEMLRDGRVCEAADGLTGVITR